MAKLASPIRLALVASLLAALSTPVFAQLPGTASRTIYVGTALNATRAAGEVAAAPESTLPPDAATVASAANEPLALDLTVYDDGFVYGRLLLPRRGLVVAGSGSVQDGVELRLIFNEARPGAAAGWDAEFAHSALTSGDTDLRAALAAAQGRVVGSFSGRRDMDFGSEGRLVSGALAFTAEPATVLNAELHRFAQYATWEFTQGRLHASYTSPHLFGGDGSLNDLLESDGRARLEEFVAEGRQYAAEGVLGWAWEIEEYVTLEGLAGSYLSLLNTIYSYTGGAHPNTFYESYLVELRPSAVNVLGVQDLFRPDSSWLPRLTPLILGDLEAQEAAWVTQGQVKELTLNDLATFTLGPAGLTFHFPPYAMGPYVQGAFAVTLPYDRLVGLAPAGGVLELFARGVAVR